MRVTALFFAGSLVFMLGFDVFAHFFMPKHPVPNWSLGMWMLFVSVLAFFTFGLSALAWPIECRVRWTVGASGILVNKSGRERTISWSEVTRIRFVPLAVTVQVTSKPHLEGLPFPARGDTEWLKRISAKRVGNNFGVAPKHSL